MPKSSGFTLIELLITVAIVAILVLIAYPSLSRHLIKSKRIEAIQALYIMQLQQEEWRIAHASYANTADAAANFVPSHEHYIFKVSAASATDYTLKASAKSGSAQYQDKAGSIICHTLTLDRNNNKAPADCWR